MTRDERYAMTVAVAQAYVDHSAAQYERLGFSEIQLHKVKQQALDRFNAWLTAVREGAEDEDA